MTHDIADPILSSRAQPRVVVELGSGPLVSGLVSASSWAHLLVYSDLLDTNLATLASSLNKINQIEHQVNQTKHKQLEEVESNEQVSKDVDHPELASLRFIAELEQISTTALMVRMARAPRVLAQCDLFRWAECEVESELRVSPPVRGCCSPASCWGVSAPPWSPSSCVWSSPSPPPPS